MHESRYFLYTTKKCHPENIMSHQDEYIMHSNLKKYTIGFILAIILTITSFWLVISKVISNTDITSLVLFFLAIVQIIIHMIYFLHMNFKSEGGWTMLALIFTILVITIMMTGSLWVMYHMNYNMTPR